MQQRLRAILVFALGICFGSPAYATPSDDFRLGVEAFRNARYEQALNHFMAARSAGMETATLHYNLGSTYYRLGRFEDAMAQFDVLSDHATWRELAYYNMGLVEEQRRREGAALDHYRRAFDLAQLPQVKALAAARIESLSAASSTATDQSWAGLLSFGGGHDDNVLLADNQSTSGTSNESDQFLEMQAFASRYVHGGFENGWRLDLGGSYRTYSELNDYDFGSAHARLQHSRLLTHWFLETGGRIEAQKTGSQYLATVGTFSLQGMRATGPMVVRLRGEISYYAPGSAYAFIGGWQGRSGIEVSRRSENARVRFGYEVEANNRKDNSTASEFTSYSPLRSRFYVAVRRNFGSRFQMDARVDYGMSRYVDPNVQLDAGSVPTSAKRKDDRLGGALRLTLQPGTRWKWFADYQFVDNDSNFGHYAYRSGQGSLGVEMTF
jgi:tetratricopeptide (TPR) repeat protein